MLTPEESEGLIKALDAWSLSTATVLRNREASQLNSVEDALAFSRMLDHINELREAVERESSPSQPVAPEKRSLTKDEAQKIKRAVWMAYPGPYPHIDPSNEAMELTSLIDKVTEA